MDALSMKPACRTRVDNAGKLAIREHYEMLSGLVTPFLNTGRTL